MNASVPLPPDPSELPEIGHSLDLLSRAKGGDPGALGELLGNRPAEHAPESVDLGSSGYFALACLMSPAST